MTKDDIQAILYRRFNGGFRAAIETARSTKDPELVSYVKEMLTRAYNRSGSVAAVKLARASKDSELMKHVLQLKERAMQLALAQQTRCKRPIFIYAPVGRKVVPVHCIEGAGWARANNFLAAGARLTNLPMMKPTRFSAEVVVPPAFVIGNLNPNEIQRRKDVLRAARH